MSDEKAPTPAKRTKRAPKATDPAVLDEHEHGNAAKPISLRPLDFGTALKGLLSVPWPAGEKKVKTRKKTDSS